MGAIKIELKEYKRKGITFLSDLDFDILNVLMQRLRLKPSAFPAHTQDMICCLKQYSRQSVLHIAIHQERPTTNLPPTFDSAI